MKIFGYLIILSSFFFENTKCEYFGCLFDEKVCTLSEFCYQDNLFGKCVQIGAASASAVIFKPSQADMQMLEHLLKRLIQQGWTWRQEFTQCVVRKALKTIEMNQAYDEEEISAKFVHACANLEDESRRNKLRERKKQRLEKIAESSLQDSETLATVANNGDTDEIQQLLEDLTDPEINQLKNYLTDEDDDNTKRMLHPTTITKVLVNFDPNEDTDVEPQDEEEEDAGASSVQDKNVGNDAKSEETVKDDVGFKQDLSKLEENNKNAEVPMDTILSPGNQIVEMDRPTTKVYPKMYQSLMGSKSRNNFDINRASKEAGSVRMEQIEYSRLAHTRHKYLMTLYILCALVLASLVSAITLYIVKRRNKMKEKQNGSWACDPKDDGKQSKDLYRHQIQGRNNEKSVSPHLSDVTVQELKKTEWDVTTPKSSTSSANSSSSPWADELTPDNLDISTGHIILSYMENHLKNKERLAVEWEALSCYDAEPCSIVAAIEPVNMRKNRFTDMLPYEHSRVKLKIANNLSGSDYINANFIADHDPRNPVYIATQAPLSHTVADFWQMVWERHCLVIVNLTRLSENSLPLCHKYWPEDIKELHHIFEVQMISEHLLTDDYTVRSFFLKNLKANETRTITQLHLNTWPNNGLPAVKSLLEFRRKVNKCYRKKSCPIIIHCSDGAGRTGTYCAIDMVLNRIHKGAKEIDIAATVEHLRDQRANMVRNKEQFEFSLLAIAEEIQSMVNICGH